MLVELLDNWIFPFGDLLICRDQPIEFERIEALFPAEEQRTNLVGVDEPLNLRLG